MKNAQDENLELTLQLLAIDLDQPLDQSPLEPSSARRETSA